MAEQKGCRVPRRRLLGECGRPTVRPGGRCLFHSTSRTADQQAVFKAELAAEIERLEGDDTVDVIDLSGFVFPSLTFGEIAPVFCKPVVFEKAVFERLADFAGCVFEAEADFFRATFEDEPVYLCQGKFAGTRFRKRASFWCVEFQGEGVSNPSADFSKAVFEDTAAFNSTVFNGWASFNNVVFEGPTAFRGANFGGMGGRFSGARFDGPVDFSESQFDHAEFSRCRFADDVRFVDSVFPATTVRDEHSVFLIKGIFLREAEFKMPDRVRFQGTRSKPIDLSHVSFLSTPLQDVVFVDERWGSRPLLFGLRRRRALIDENLIEKSEDVEKRMERHPAEMRQQLPSYEKVRHVYRQLRRNYEKLGRYAEAGDFFVGEMEVRRKDVRMGNPVLRAVTRKVSPIALYKHLALYGESYYRLIGWSVLVIVTCALVRLVGDDTPPVPFGIGTVLGAFGDSVAAFFQLPRHNDTLDIVERILAAPLLGLLLVSLKRNFERK